MYINVDFLGYRYSLVGVALLRSVITENLDLVQVTNQDM